MSLSAYFDILIAAFFLSKITRRWYNTKCSVINSFLAEWFIAFVPQMGILNWGKQLVIVSVHCLLY